MDAPIKPNYTAGALLGIKQAPAVVAVVGCGGKTTFAEVVAREYPCKKVLISPTAKIKPMRDADVTLCTTLSDCLVHTPETGIQCLGLRQGEKLSSLPPDVLAEIVPGYDLVLLEADGSRGLPCKGWLQTEPVIPPYCTHTVGIVTFGALGRPADEHTVLRLQEFLTLTGLKKNAPIHALALRDMVCAADGMFKNAAGETSIFINRIETDSDAQKAEAWLWETGRSYPGRFSHLAYGSAQTNSWKEVIL